MSTLIVCFFRHRTDSMGHFGTGLFVVISILKRTIKYIFLFSIRELEKVHIQSSDYACVSPATSRYNMYHDTVVRYNTYHDMVAIYLTK
jgi:hypothetical protein